MYEPQRRKYEDERVRQIITAATTGNSGRSQTDQAQSILGTELSKPLTIPMPSNGQRASHTIAQREAR